MPACLTHHCFARRVLEQLSDKDSVNATAFFWGAQGPDFLFCHRYFPWMQGRSLKSFGNRIHEENPVKTFGAVREFLKRHTDPAYRSYVWGLLCHYALDSTAHPYINALADRLVAERPAETRTTMHGEIEAALDAIVLRRETGKLPSEVPLGRMFPKNEPVQRRIAKLYRDLIFRLYDEDISEAELLRATEDAHFVFSCLTDRLGLKKRMFDVLEKGKAHVISSHIVPITEDDSVDYANVQNTEWTAGGETSQESFFDLFDRSLEKADVLIRNFFDGNLSALTEERPFG